MGQRRRGVPLHQEELAEGAQRKGIAGLQHHRLLQRTLGGIGIVVPQGRDPKSHLGVGIAGLQLHRPAQQLTATPWKTRSTGWENCVSVLNSVSVRELIETGWR